jgi:branched-chain amino acid transport system substrate-binding protein
MSKRLFVLISLVIAASMLLAACGSAASTTKTLKIVSDEPMTGASLTQTQTIVNAEELRLAEANNQACGGKYKISFEAWDDASAALGKWDPAVETANANKAAADKTIVAYLGTFNSGAAKLSIPILNQAGQFVDGFPGQYLRWFDDHGGC